MSARERKYPIAMTALTGKNKFDLGIVSSVITIY